MLNFKETFKGSVLVDFVVVKYATKYASLTNGDLANNHGVIAVTLF